jgi:hypothetical protein
VRSMSGWTKEYFGGKNRWQPLLRSQQPSSVLTQKS